MTRERAIAKLKMAQQDMDQDGAHRDADEVLCEMLTALGYGDVVAEYYAVEKWFS